MKIQRITYLSLGSNQGDKLKNLQKAIYLIANKVGPILKISSIYNTPAIGFKGEDFFNICLKISTYLPPSVMQRSTFYNGS